MCPESIFSVPRGDHLPSHVTFLVNADSMFPQTGHPWCVEMNHELDDLKIYSLIPQKSNNQYVSHYKVESRRPRFVGQFTYTDAWLTTHHRLLTVNDTELHFSRSLFNPTKADDKLYFDQAYNRLEIVKEGFIEDREIFRLLEGVVPKEYEIQSLLQRQP